MGKEIMFEHDWSGTGSVAFLLALSILFVLFSASLTELLRPMAGLLIVGLWCLFIAIALLGHVMAKLVKPEEAVEREGSVVCGSVDGKLYLTKDAIILKTVKLFGHAYMIPFSKIADVRIDSHRFFLREEKVLTVETKDGVLFLFRGSATGFGFNIGDWDALLKKKLRGRKK